MYLPNLRPFSSSSSRTAACEQGLPPPARIDTSRRSESTLAATSILLLARSPSAAFNHPPRASSRPVVPPRASRCARLRILLPNLFLIGSLQSVVDNSHQIFIRDMATPNKNWIDAPQNSEEYVNGVVSFLNFAFSNIEIDDDDDDELEISCPCVKCLNQFWFTREVVFNHLIVNRFDKGYRVWNFHGESSTASSNEHLREHDRLNTYDDIGDMIHDAYVMSGFETTKGEESHKGPDENAKKFYKLLEDADDELYPDCKSFSVLSFAIRLYLLKCRNGWSNTSVTDLLKTLKEVFPFAKIPDSFQHLKRMVSALGLDYKRIHACPNDCMLYWKEHKDDRFCRVCKASRWKLSDKEREEGLLPDTGIPAKVLRYFPLKSRLQRLFMSTKTAEHMTWHHVERPKDGMLRHPADGQAWRDFDSLHSDFAFDPRNVRLGLTSDGFNPFRTMSVSYSIWPVVLSIYNLPPWLCNKSEYYIMSLIIPGPLSPGYDIDVYLQPLIEELKDLWESGVDTYDASKDVMFRMRAALLWTINDFPAYSMLSGWSTKGALACPVCNFDTCSRYLRNSRKFCYMGHRRFLEEAHPFRRNKSLFDGNTETRSAPTVMSGLDMFAALEGFENKFGKSQRKSKSANKSPLKKASIFFQLPYWRTNRLRHNLDVMHIEKNICDNILGTLLDIPGKTKDHLNGRLDLKEMGIRKELQPKRTTDNKHFLLSKACFSMTKEEKTLFCKVIKGAKFPHGCVSNISRSVQLSEGKISGYKSHDAHFLLHYLLQVAVRKTLPKQVATTLIKLGAFFRCLCSKVVNPHDLDMLQSDIISILCQLEKIFIPSFFDIMVHLPIHLVDEVRLGGPVQHRWMYSKERYLGKLKSYVKNRCRPEGSIAEGYLAEECLVFCSRYLRHNACSKDNELTGDDAFTEGGNEMFPLVGKPIGGKKGGKGRRVCLDDETRTKAHRYVLFNCDQIRHHVRDYDELLKRKRKGGKKKRWDTEQKHANDFVDWFSDKMKKESASPELVALSRGPDYVVRSFKGYLVNGYKFYTATHDAKRKTQCSGVTLTALTSSFASSKDQNPALGNVMYYGALQDIYELDYFGHFQVVLFRCTWFTVQNDEYGLTRVNFRKLCYSNDPFVLASQVQQVVYVQDPVEEDWHYVVKTIPRDLFDMEEDSTHEDTLASFFTGPEDVEIEHQVPIHEDDVQWLRDGIPATTVEVPLTLLESQLQGNSDSSDDEICDDTLWDFFDEE